MKNIKAIVLSSIVLVIFGMMIGISILNADTVQSLIVASLVLISIMRLVKRMKNFLKLMLYRGSVISISLISLFHGMTSMGAVYLLHMHLQDMKEKKVFVT